MLSATWYVYTLKIRYHLILRELLKSSDSWIFEKPSVPNLWRHLLTVKATSAITEIQSTFLRRHRVIKLPNRALNADGPVYSSLLSVYFPVTEERREFNVKRHTRAHAHDYLMHA